MIKRERHGLTKSRAHQAWTKMRNRCLNPKNEAFANYGARGITVCKEWDSFSAFLADMGEPPAGMSIDRIDNNGGYFPSNCRWADRKTQSRNRRGRHILTIDGETKMLCEWSEATGIPHTTILTRLRQGWTEREAVLTPKIILRAGIKRGARVRDHQAAENEITLREQTQ